MKNPKNMKDRKQNKIADASGKTSGASPEGDQDDGHTDATDDAEQSMDAITLIKNDHRKVEALFEQFENASSNQQKAEATKQVCTELIAHATIEEEIFYPACRAADVEDSMLDEAQVEHDGVKVLIRDLMRGAPDEPFYDAKVKVLAEYVKHHVAEEEEPNQGILAKAQRAGIDMDVLGQKLRTRKMELMRQAKEKGFGLPVPKSLHTTPQRYGENPQEDRRMDRSTTRERDDQGRFVSDDDDRGRRYSRSDREYDRRFDRPRDERGRFESDDDRRGWSRGRDEDDDYRRSRGRYEDDYEDRPRSRSRDDDDWSRGGGRGWSGDSEGHAEAARRGWDERRSYRSRSRSDDDDRRGGSRSGRDEGHGGWFGDSRGHSEAARRGWDERSSGQRGRWDEDDRVRSRASERSRSEGYDDRRRSQSRDDDEGHGGWFGDSRGHAEAARRGWQHRDRD